MAGFEGAGDFATDAGQGLAAHLATGHHGLDQRLLLHDRCRHLGPLPVTPEPQGRQHTKGQEGDLLFNGQLGHVRTPEMTVAGPSGQGR